MISRTGKFVVSIISQNADFQLFKIFGFQSGRDVDKFDGFDHFGSTYEGRKDSAREILGAEYTVPIVVEDTDNLVIFPTTSPFSASRATCTKYSENRIYHLRHLEFKDTNILCGA